MQWNAVATVNCTVINTPLNNMYMYEKDTKPKLLSHLVLCLYENVIQVLHLTQITTKPEFILYVFYYFLRS